MPVREAKGMSDSPTKRGTRPPLRSAGEPPLRCKDKRVSMKNDRDIKKNQHYVPQSYLRRFTIEGEKSLLWSFDKEKREFLQNKSSVNKVCSEDYYYYQLDENGGYDHIQLEDSLSEVERIGNNIIIKITNIHSKPYASISEEEKGQFAFYISLMLTRGPSFRAAINELHGKMVKLTLEELYNSGSLQDMPASLQALVDEKDIENIITANIYSSVSLQPMVESAQQIAHSMLTKRWIFYMAPAGMSFVTSDTPVSFYSAFGGMPEIGPAHQNAEILFPISKIMTLVVSPIIGDNSDFEFIDCSYDNALKFNSIIANTANKLIFGPEKYDWLPELVSNRKGQKLVSGVDGAGFHIVDNPYKKRKLTKHTK